MHNEHNILMDKVYYKGADYCIMQKMNKVFDEHFRMLKEKYPEVYTYTIDMMKGVVYELTKEKAQEIVRNFKPYGEKWSYDTIREVLSKKGIEENCVKFYLEMNKHYNKHYETAKMLGKQEDVDFYFNLSRDSIFEKGVDKFHIEKHYM